MSELTTAEPSFVQSLIGEYGSAAVVTPEENATETPVNEQAPSPEPLAANSESWRGNPAYYQSGAKVGQLRPTRSPAIAVTYKKDETVETISGDLITGAMFLTMVNLLLPNLICWLGNKVTKKDVKAVDIQLSKDQIKQLEPIANKSLSQVNLHATPTTALWVTTAGIMLFNYAMSASIAPKKNEK